MNAEQIAHLTGCSLEIAAECIAKRPGNPTAQVALARLKAPKLTAHKPAAAAAPGPAACGHWYRNEPVLHGTLCPICIANAQRKRWCEE